MRSACVIEPVDQRECQAALKLFCSFPRSKEIIMSSGFLARNQVTQNKEPDRE